MPTSPSLDAAASQRMPFFGHALASVVLVASLLLVLAYWRNAQQRGLRNAEADFRRESAQTLELLRQRLLNYELLVRGGASLQASLPQPSRQQWQQYVSGLDIETRFPAVHALGFALDVDPQQLGALQQVLPGMAWGATYPGADAEAAATATRAGSGLHAVVLYVAPDSPVNLQAAGTDLSRQADWRATMERAAKPGDLRLSGPVPAMLGTTADGRRDKIAMLAPVFAAGRGAAGAGAARGDLRGWVFAQIDLATYVKMALQSLQREARLRVIDTTDAQPVLVHADPGFSGQPSVQRGDQPAFVRRLDVDMLGRRWQVDFESRSFAEIQGSLPGLRATLLGGLLASLLLFGIALSLARTEAKANALAARLSDSYRRSEQRFRSAMQYSAIGKALLDHEGRIIEANPALAQILGSNQETLAGTMLGQHFVEGQDESVRTIERDAVADGAYQTTRRLQRSDGGVRHASLTFATVPGDVGQDFARLVQVEDVTERLRAEARVQALNRTLEARVALRTRELSHANQELEAFAYSVSHDLRAPLRSIDGFSRLLGERYHDAIDASGQDYLLRIRNATARMSDLIDALLKMSRVSRAELQHAPVDLSRVAQDIAAELRSGDPSRDVAFDIAPGLSARGDPALLRNLLENLLGNAWKFTHGREDARIAVGSNPQGEYFVRDNGAGFAPEYAPKLFRPFQRLHSEAEYAGHGIGLASVKRIVERHGGSIRAEGQTGQGAAFYFRLPVETAEA